VRSTSRLRIHANLAPLLLAAWLAFVPDHAGSPPPARDAEHEAEAYPSDWFGMQRAFPNQTIDQDAYLEALNHARVERGAVDMLDSGPYWTEGGPFNIGGRVTALAVVPGGTTLYLGSAAGGVFKSTNSGTNWTQVLAPGGHPRAVTPIRARPRFFLRSRIGIAREVGDPPGHCSARPHVRA